MSAKMPQSFTERSQNKPGIPCIPLMAEIVVV